jgi:tetratricopeptide (TPR) repeat protein
MTPEEKIWWLYIDADEFPNFANRFTLLDILKRLDSSVRAIQGYMFDHIPTHQPYHVRGYHPADFQPLCAKTSGSKIPLLRYDKGHPHLWSIGGAHDFITHGEDIAILKDFLQIHHFPYRNPEFTLPRTKTLAQFRNAWYKKFLHQVHAPDTSAYETRYKQLKAMYDKNKHQELKTNALLYDYRYLVRWYNRYAERKLPCSNLEKHIAHAIYYFFLEEYDIALCRFNDALSICDDDSIKLWLMIKIAECFLATGNDEANTIFSSVKKYDDSEIHAYIDTCFTGKRRKRSHVREDAIRKVEWYTSVLPADI